MIAVIINAITVIVGASIGLLAKKAIPDGWSDIIMRGMGLIAMYIGIRGIFDGENTIVMIISLVIGEMLA